MKRHPNASTVAQEESRKNTQQLQKNLHRELKQRLGIVSEVHPILPMIKANANTGAPIAGGDWIGVGHSVLDIAHRFGALRKGLRVLITYSGEVESAAMATIVGVEDEKLGSEISTENDLDSQMPYRLLTPGSGF